MFQILVHIESKLSLYQYIVLQKTWKMHKRPNLSIPVTPKLLWKAFSNDRIQCNVGADIALHCAGSEEKPSIMITRRWCCSLLIKVSLWDWWSAPPPLGNLVSLSQKSAFPIWQTCSFTLWLGNSDESKVMKNGLFLSNAIQSVTFVKIRTRMNIRIYFYQKRLERQIKNFRCIISNLLMGLRTPMKCETSTVVMK